MADLKKLIEKYKKFFGASPEFGAEQTMKDDKMAEAIECCIDNNITASELMDIGKDHAYIAGRLILLPPSGIRELVKNDEDGIPVLEGETTPEQKEIFDRYLAEFNDEMARTDEKTPGRSHCSVWDYLMNGDLDKEGACKYGEREKR